MSDNILNTIISVSEKAANIARICRQDIQLLSYLVQEKKESEKNNRFVADFKTLADVLVQELVKYELCSKFPSTCGKIYGEENNEFESCGETVVIEVKSRESETADLLYRILGDLEASETLAKTVHSKVGDQFFEDVDIQELPENIGVWIDPIDSTAEYIRGGENEKDGLVFSGLPCVTVLIGVFDQETGSPILGVINQPFYKSDNDTWSGRYIYGFNFRDLKLSRPQFPIVNDKLIAVSSSESVEVKQALVDNGYMITEAAGAGYKLLNIITGVFMGYVLSKPTSYLWDICACHAILDSINGGIIDFKTLTPIRYKGGHGVKYCCNSGGIIAYRDEVTKVNLINIFRKHTNDLLQ